MCDERGESEPVLITNPDRSLEREFSKLISSGLKDVDPGLVARIVCEMPERRAPQVGFVGYGSTEPGDRVLLAVDSWYERAGGPPDVMLLSEWKQRGFGGQR